VELVSEFCFAWRLFGWLPWRLDRPDGGALGALEIRQAGQIGRRHQRENGVEDVRPLLVDLETAWRGGQNQALLLLKGLHARGHQAELVAGEQSALGDRAAPAGLPVHFVSRGMLRLPAAWKIRELLLS